MAYDLDAAKGPRLAGRKLRMVSSLANNRVTAGAICAKMLAEVGIKEFRTCAPGDDPPKALDLRTYDVEDRSCQTTDPQTWLNDLMRRAKEEPEHAERTNARATSVDYHRAYLRGDLDPVDVAKSFLACRARLDGEGAETGAAMNIFIATDQDDLLEQARASSQRYREGHPLSVLDGVPVTVKDEVDQIGYATTVGTSFLGEEPCTRDATAVARLRAHGALLVGKANMHELGIGVTGINPHHGPARNPFAPNRFTGGSSSGSAAAVSVGLSPLALGADGGGSIRIPAGLCGVVGLKPTFGRVSEHGAAPLCWSVAHIGPMGGSALDAGIGFAVMSGLDHADSATVGTPDVALPSWTMWDQRSLEGLRVGVFHDWFDDADPQIVTACTDALDWMRERGATIIPIEIPELNLVRLAHLVTIAVEMAAGQQGLVGDRKVPYGPDTRLNLTVARGLTGADYVHAQRHRRRLTRQFLEVLDTVDVIATPTTGSVSQNILPDSLTSGEVNVPLLTKIMRFAAAANLTGVPAISVPAGLDDEGLPIGLQFMGRPWDEGRLLLLAHVLEQRVDQPLPGTYVDLIRETEKIS